MKIYKRIYLSAMKDSKYIYFLRLDFKKFLILDTLSILFGEKIKEKDLKKEKKEK